MRLQARVVAAKYHALRLLTCRLRGESAGIAQLVVKLTGCELAHQINALALDAMGELGMLYHRSAYERDRGRWLFQYMFSLGLIIGGGTAQIQKNIISERGLGMPREQASNREAVARSEAPPSEDQQAMDFGLSEEQRLLADALGGFLEKELPPARVRAIAAGEAGHDASCGARSRSRAWPACWCRRPSAAAGSALLDAVVVAQALGFAARRRPSSRPP